MDYSEKIKKLRKEAGYSQAEMAESIGISQAAYGKIESGFTKSITIDVAIAIAFALNRRFDSLFEIPFLLREDSAKLQLTITELTDKKKELEKRIEEKDLLIEMFKNEKVRLREDIIHYLEEIYDMQSFYLKKNKDAYGLSDFQIELIHNDIIGLPSYVAKSFFLSKGLIKESDFDELAAKQNKPIVLPGEPPEKD